MKKLLLILGIIEGRDWNPKEGSKALIEAHLDNHKLSTNIFPLSNSPKIHAEVTWETGKQTIRSYKLGRVPIKLECFALDDKDNRKLLGYIVLPLTSAVEGIQADSKWYRLLGGAKGTHKTAPSILLRLHLETMTFDQHTQVNGKQTQGTRDLEDARMQSVFEKKKVAQDRINPMTSRQTNGNEDYAQYPPLQVQNSRFTTTSNGNCVDGNIIDEMDSDLEEDGEVVEEEEEEGELLDSEKECSDEDQNDNLGMITEAYSLNESMEEGEDDCSVEGSEKNENTGEERLKMQRNSRKTSSDNSRNIEGRIFEKASTSNKITKGNSDHKAFMMARTSLREELQKHSESIKVASPEIRLGDLSVNNRNKSFEKRILDTSNMLDRSLRRNKSLQMDNSKEGSFAEASRGSSHSARDECDLSSDLKRRLSQCKGTTFAGMVLSQSFETAPKPSEPQQKQNSSEFKYSYTEKLVAELNPEESCFYIGPKEEEMEEFSFSVTILYAKNLSKIVPGDFIPTAENGFHFQYSLLGCPINTDPFYNLDSPEFVAEKATAKIRSTSRSLFLYFSQNYIFPVRFMSGDYSLGMFTVDVGFLIDIASKSRVKFQDVFEINSVSKSISTNSDSDKHSAIAAISIEVCKSSKSDIIIPSVNKLSPLNLRRPTLLTHNPICISENESSCSDHEEELRFKNKGRTRKKRARFSLRDYLHEDERVQEKKELESEMKKLLLEAAYEVERWKAEQQKHFLKEWKAKEETLQTLLASEWTSKIKIIEEELSHRLTECDKLQEKLNSGLAELSLREEKFKAKENQVKRLEQEMLLEKEQFHASKLKGSQQEAGRASSIQCRRKADDIEKQRNERLQKEVLKLEEELKSSEELVRSHREEVISLRRKLLLTGDIIGVTKEKEILHNKIETLQERKQYYKSQWLSALTDLHKFHAAHKKAVENLTIDGKFRSDLPPRHVSLMEPSSAAVRLKKLKDERKLLLDTGFYPLDHSIIKNIDKKIKEVVG